MIADLLWLVLVSVSMFFTFIAGWYKGYNDGKEIGQGIGYRRGRSVNR